MQLDEAIQQLSNSRRADPLLPATLIAPTRLSALALRRELARRTPYAAVRFETLPRLAELVGAGALAAEDKRPLARPIGDYAARLVAGASSGVFAKVADLPGYARVLRRHFQRLRRGGIRTSADLVGVPRDAFIDEFLRAYDAFRDLTHAFYDDEDLFDAATAAAGRAGVTDELGDVDVVPPGPRTAGSNGFLGAVAASGSRIEPIQDRAEYPAPAFALMPDPFSEAENAAREVIRLLERGAALHEVAVFHGADNSYSPLLAGVFARAGIPGVRAPGQPLIETPAGRAALALVRLPALDYARVAVMDFLALAQTPRTLPAGGATVTARTTTWDRLSREAGVTHGEDRWRGGLGTLSADLRERSQNIDDPAWRERVRQDAEFADDLRAVIQQVVSRLEPLRVEQPAARFIASLKSAVGAYIWPGSRGYQEVLDEIEQLGTVGAIGGTFTLDSFINAFEANLRLGAIREGGRNDGILIADYRAAAGLQFPHVVVCGAYEGAFPSTGAVEPVVDDTWWSAAHVQHPFIEDTTARLERERAAARRCFAAATSSLTISIPLAGDAGTHDRYPAPIVAELASRLLGRQIAASEIRRTGLSESTRGGSPLASIASGPALDAFELEVRQAIAAGQNRLWTPPEGHRLLRPVALRAARRDAWLSEWDGLLHMDLPLLPEDRELSATSIEDYSTCGFKFFCRSILRLHVPDEPEERQTMDPATRGNIVHSVLRTFFSEQKQHGRPAPDEPWNAQDLERLLEILDQEMARARARGQVGLSVFHTHEIATLRADLERFLKEDSLDRLARRARPAEFEWTFAGVEIGGRRFRGAADRIDVSEDGARALIIDYKTGSTYGYEEKANDPFNGGQQLQLGIYSAAFGTGQGVTVAGRYWFISQRGEFATREYLHTPEHAEHLEKVIRAITGGVAEGSFPAVPGDEDQFGGFENCRYCHFTRICSRRRLANFTAREGHPSLAPWARVGDVARGTLDE